MFLLVDQKDPSARWNRWNRPQIPVNVSQIGKFSDFGAKHFGQPNFTEKITLPTHLSAAKSIQTLATDYMESVSANKLNRWFGTRSVCVNASRRKTISWIQIWDCQILCATDFTVFFPYSPVVCNIYFYLRFFSSADFTQADLPDRKLCVLVVLK